MKNTKKILALLASIDDLEFRYLRYLVGIASDARTLKHENELSDQEFCDLVQIDPSELKSYLQGGRNYSIEDMARIQAGYSRMAQKKAENRKANVSINAKNEE